MEGAAFYARQGDTYFLKLTGDVRYTISCTLSDFLDDLFTRDDFTHIVVDLTSAHSIDSTSLGLLAKIANFNRQRSADKTTLLSTHADINQLLETMGFYEVFNISDTGEHITATMKKLKIQSPEKEQLTQIVFEAHRTLSDLNSHNRGMFKGVLNSLHPDSKE